MIDDPALDAAIEHWWKNAEMHDRDLEYYMFADNCALCQERLTTDTDIVCEGRPPNIGMCPIMKHTGRPSCIGTPWIWVYKKARHPWVMAKWLEDLRAGRKPPVYRGKDEVNPDDQ